MSIETAQVTRWPAGATSDYIEARKKLTDAEWDLRNQLEAVAAQRRALPPGPLMKEYTFTEPVNPSNSDDTATKKVTLAELAADGRPLLIYHLMFEPNADSPCSMCASFVDSVDSVANHMAQHATLVTIAKAPIAKQKAFFKARGWNKIRFLSSEGSSFNEDMNVENVKWHPDYAGQMPGFTVLRKNEEGVRHLYTQTADFDKDHQRGLDLMSPLWMMCDYLPEGRPEWMPKNRY